MLSEWETNPPKRHPERIRVEISWLSKLAGPSESGQNKKKNTTISTADAWNNFLCIFLGSVHGFYVFSIHLFNLPFTAHKWRRA